jgi:serine/threonine-protein kinase SRPK3
MVFEILRCNLLDILKRYNYEGVPMDICQEICRQVLIGLDYLHRICGVIHTDLKPENVMVCLSAEEIQDIVDNGQLTKNQLFAERTETFQKMLGIAVKSQPVQLNTSQSNLKNGTVVLPSMEGLTKTQKKNLKKKLKKKMKKEK